MPKNLPGFTIPPSPAVTPPFTQGRHDVFKIGKSPLIEGFRFYILIYYPQKYVTKLNSSGIVMTHKVCDIRAIDAPVEASCP